PALADLSLASAASASDTEEAFGVRADEHGGYVRLSEADAARGVPEDHDDAAGEHRGEQPLGVASAASVDASPEAQAEQDRTDPWAEDPDPEDVVDDPPAEPITDYDRPRAGAAAAGGAAAGASAAAVAGTDVSGELYSEQHDPGSASAGTGAAFVDDEEHEARRGDREAAVVGGSGGGAAAAAGGTRGSGPGRWLALLLLGAVLLIVGIVIFTQLGGGDDVADGDEDQDEEAVADGEDDGEADEPELEIASVTREVPDNEELGEDFDEDLNNLIDDDESTSWGTFNYGSAAFGGYASEMAVVAELEEPGEVTQVTVDQDPAQQGGSFEILVNDEATVEGATNVGSGSFGDEPAVVDLDEPTEASYVILSISEVPENSEPDNPDLPYRLDIREFDVR
ncbi:MAG: hypothetical protein Q4F53_04905, partial [Nesterenkonia sp.]|nr:hypothetical protein [Nesterenkonia sp.]